MQWGGMTTGWPTFPLSPMPTLLACLMATLLESMESTRVCFPGTWLICSHSCSAVLLHDRLSHAVPPPPPTRVSCPAPAPRAPPCPLACQVCGPPGMMAAISGPKNPDYSQGEVGGVLKDLGYTSAMVFKF